MPSLTWNAVRSRAWYDLGHPCSKETIQSYSNGHVRRPVYTRPR